MNRKVHVGACYFYVPVLLDRIHPPHNAAPFGSEVRVINLPGAPKANTMGHCYVQCKDTKAFAGLVCTNSLLKLDEYKAYLQKQIAEKEAAL